jgi:hypothetical protein
MKNIFKGRKGVVSVVVKNTEMPISTEKTPDIVMSEESIRKRRPKPRSGNTR